MTINRLSIPIACSVLALSTLATQAAAKKATPDIEVVTDGSTQELTWNINKEWHSATLKLSGAGIEEFFTQFSAGETISLGILGADDSALPDGFYKWELVVNSQAPTSRLSQSDTAPVPALKESGIVSIVKSSFLIPTTTNGSDRDETSVTKDQVFQDDLIVMGSIAAGFDAVNGENFGFDTIRLKENNLRVSFIDTSSSSSFPTTDWQIRINDSGNGGGNYFAIEDLDAGRTPFLIEATAPTNSLYVDDAGRIGIGTASPVVETHVVDGDSPTLRLEQDGSSGFTPQTWDVASNETNFFIRDATNGSTLPFRIRPGAPSSSIYIDTDGDIGLGTASPSARLDVVGDLEVNGSINAIADTASITVTDTSATVATRAALTLSNNGPVQSILKDTSNNVTWLTETTSTGNLLHGKLAAAAYASELTPEGGLTLTGDTAALSVSNSNATTADRTTLALSNNGGNSIILDNTNSYAWEMKATDGHTFDLYNTGPFTDAIVSVNLAGQMTVKTSISAPVITQTSDLNVKEDIILVNTKDILSKVVAMPISEWTFDFDKTDSRHIGPMAQDFKKQFNLGSSDKTISVGDAAGVALAAIKGLNEVINEKDVKIDALKEKSDKMELQLELLMKEVEALKSKN